MDHDETKLPKWAQSLIADLRREIDMSKSEVNRYRQAHAVLDRKGWFTICGPPARAIVPSAPEHYHLFYMSCDGAHPACSLGVGDIVLVGRADKNGDI